MFTEILTLTNETAMVYFERATKDISLNIGNCCLRPKHLIQIAHCYPSCSCFNYLGVMWWRTLWSWRPKMQITNRRRGCGSFCCMFKDILIMIIVSVIIGIRHHSSHQPYHHQHQGLYFSSFFQDWFYFLFPAQKNAQLDLDEHILLHDCCALWVWTKKKLGDIFPSSVVDQHQELFEQGFLGTRWGYFSYHWELRVFFMWI